MSSGLESTFLATMGDELSEWMDRVGRRHGFLQQPGGGGAQSEEEGLRQMREHNARLLQEQEERRQRAGQRAEELRAQGMDVEVEENPDGSIVVIGEGDRPDSPQARMREHNERLQAQLEERRRRAEEEVARLRAEGFDARLEENPDGSIVVTGQRDRLPASSQGDSETAELAAEARQLRQRATAAVEGMLTAVHRSEHVDFQNRLHSIEARLDDPAQAENAQELRRVIGDLRELIEDVEARSREVDRDTDTMIAGQADGSAGPEVPARHRAADSDRQASGDQDADFDALNEEAQQLYRRAQELLEGMDSRLGTAEGRELASRLNTFAGRLRDPALRGDADEARRVVSDLYATVQDFERRARELERSPASANRGPDDPAGGDARQNPSARADADFAALNREAQELHRQASALYDSVAGRLPEADHRDLRNRVNAFAGEIRDPANQGNAQELRRVITDLRALIADMQSRARELR